MEIPLNLTLVNQEIDVLIFLFIVYIPIFYFWKKLINNDLSKKITWYDLQFSAIFLILGYLNYYGNSFEIFSTTFHWWIYIISVQFFVELFYSLLGWRHTKKYFKNI